MIYLGSTLIQKAVKKKIQYYIQCLAFASKQFSEEKIRMISVDVARFIILLFLSLAMLEVFQNENFLETPFC